MVIIILIKKFLMIIFLSETVFLPHKNRGKVCTHLTVPRPHLWYYTRMLLLLLFLMILLVSAKIVRVYYKTCLMIHLIISALHTSKEKNKS